MLTPIVTCRVLLFMRVSLSFASVRARLGAVVAERHPVSPPDPLPRHLTDARKGKILAPIVGNLA
jgi:hypothetical protein